MRAGSSPAGADAIGFGRGVVELHVGECLLRATAIERQLRPAISKRHALRPQFTSVSSDVPLAEELYQFRT
jgi:hypothetical protein